MFEWLLYGLAVGVIIYIIHNEHMLKKDKIPFSTRLNEVEKKRNISKGRL